MKKIKKISMILSKTFYEDKHEDINAKTIMKTAIAIIINKIMHNMHVVLKSIS